MSILLIEDDEPLVELLRAWLGRREIRVARTLAQAYEQIILQAPRHIILDLALTDSTPSQTIDRIKDVKKQARDAVVIVVTGYPTHEAAARAAGADEFIAKGADTKALASELGKAIDESDRQQ